MVNCLNNYLTCLFYTTTFFFFLFFKLVLYIELIEKPAKVKQFVRKFFKWMLNLYVIILKLLSFFTLH